MILSYSERRRKLRIVTEYMCFLKHHELLAHYKDSAIVPGICTDYFCDCIITVLCDEEAGWCPDCDTYTMQSILIVAGVQ